MKKALVLLLLILFAGMLLATGIKQVHDTRKAELLRSASHVVFSTSLSDMAGCSATAVGPHTLLTAGHCVQPSGYINVDGLGGVKIVSIAFDENDHALVFLSGIVFTNVVQLKLNVQPNKTETYFMFGNPNLRISELRFGHYLGLQGWQGHLLHCYSMHTEPGDSGAGIFDPEGYVIDIVSVRMDYGKDSDRAGTFPLGFTTEQLQQIK